ncbi:MAG TPA: GxxExxY protein [Pyrinomonadaceae bacterium]|nr:GxxExxY protein [Pyrinomonadaceae bacterium]
MKEELLYSDLTYKIIGFSMKVHNTLGNGFLEKVYENSLMILFRRARIKAEQQVPIKVWFEGEVVGDYIADILVEDKIILELKVAEKISDVFKAQTLNYLKATKLDVALILNFGGKSLEHFRLINKFKDDSSAKIDTSWMTK